MHEYELMSFKDHFFKAYKYAIHYRYYIQIIQKIKQEVSEDRKNEPRKFN